MPHNDINTDALRQAISNFKYYVRPSNADSSQPCTIADLNKVIERTAKLLSVFVDELEN